MLVYQRVKISKTVIFYTKLWKIIRPDGSYFQIWLVVSADKSHLEASWYGDQYL